MTENRMASGDEAAKALWDQAVTDNIYLSRLDRLNGLGTKTVNINGTPRLLDDAAPASSVAQSFPSILPVEPPQSKVTPFIGLIVGLVGLLALLISWMGGAA